MKTTSTRSSAGAYPYRDLDRADSMPSSRCSRKASRHRAAAAERCCIATRSTTASRTARRPARGHHFRRRDPRERGLCRRGRAGGKNASAPSMRISPWRASRATCSCWAPNRGASVMSAGARCAWKTRTAHGRRCRSGWAKRRDARPSYRTPSPACASASTALERYDALESLSSDAVSTTAARGRRSPTFAPAQRPWARCPRTTTVVAERFFDESGGMQLVLHAPFGSRINRAWGLALRKRFCRTFNFELQAAATDNGIVISLSDQHAFPLEAVFEFLRPETVEDVLRRPCWRRPCSARAGAGTRRAHWPFCGSGAAARCRAPLQRMRSDDLLASVFPDQVACAENLTGPIRIPDHPLVNETIDNCLHEAMDLDGLKHVLEGIERGRIRTVAIDKPAPSRVLARDPERESLRVPRRRAARGAPRARRAVAEHAADRRVDGAGILDPAAIEQVSAEVWPDPRDADELHDALLTLVRCRREPRGSAGLTNCDAAAGHLCMDRDGRDFWVATECRRKDRRRARGRPRLDGVLRSDHRRRPRGRLRFPAGDVRIALAGLEGEGQVFQGKYRRCRRGDRVVQSPHSGAHSSERRWAACGARSNPSPRPSFTSSSGDGSTPRPARSLHGADGRAADRPAVAGL